MKLRYFYILVLLTCLTCSNAWSSEQDSKAALDKQFTIYGGARFYQADGEFSSTRTGSPVTRVDMDTLGLDENEVSGIGGFIFNFAKRWNLRFDYYGYHDNAEKSANANFNFDGINISVNAVASSSLDIDLYVLSLAYNIIHTEKARFGLGIGVHGIDFDLSISGRASVGGSEVFLGEGQEDFLIPIPNLWAYGAYGFTDNFVLRYGAGWMSAGYDDYSGSLFLFNAAVEYWFFENAGIGIGYNYLAADIDYEPGNRTENYDVDLPGIILYITLGF